MSTSLALIPSADESQLNCNAAFRELREMVLNSVASEHSKRNYAKAVDDLFALCASRPLSRALLMEYRAAMLEKKLSASTVNVRLSAIRKLVGEAHRNGILDAEQAAKMTDVPNLRQQGTRLGNWLTRDQAKELLAVPDRATIKGKRDYCTLALLVGCALRRRELSTLTLEDIQLREGRWVIVDLVGKGGRVRTVAIPVWVKNAINAWQTAAKIEDGRLLRPLSKSGRILREELGDWAIWSVVEASAKEIGIEHFGAHDLRRTCAKLCRKNGGDLEQIKFLLGHSSIQTTERYLGSEQEIVIAVNDNLGLSLCGVLDIIRAMAINHVLALLDAEIATLKEARQLLKTDSTGSAAPRRAGRPRKAENALLTAATTTAKTKKKRNVSPEGRARIAEAVKRRWAVQKKAAK